MLRKWLVKEDGQSLIHFTLIIVMLLAFVSLAVDAGNVFSMRRKLQNAADAAALAAARELCLGHTTTEASTTGQHLPDQEWCQRHWCHLRQQRRHQHDPVRQ